ncbi:MAG: DNA-directed RNA polymerase subunit delta [Bacilli bacterium]|nr:DNA-directed RNA polymerase subunit delta [Bacilli bacterium]
MSLKKMKKEDLELLSNKEITQLILEESKKPMKTADLFKKIIELLELPESTFEKKIADYFTALSTDKHFIILKDGTVDLRERHTSDKVVKVTDVDDDEDEEEEESSEDDDQDSDDDDMDEDSYDDTENDDYDEDTNEELKDLVILDEDELELEQ